MTDVQLASSAEQGVSRECFWDTGSMLDTLPGIPTSLTEAEAAELSRLAAGQRVLEFGSLLGASTILLAQAAQ